MDISQSPLLLLPLRNWLAILSQLDLDSVHQLALVSRQFCALARSDILWSYLWYSRMYSPYYVDMGCEHLVFDPSTDLNQPWRWSEETLPIKLSKYEVQVREQVYLQSVFAPPSFILIE